MSDKKQKQQEIPQRYRQTKLDDYFTKRVEEEEKSHESESIKSESTWESCSSPTSSTMSDFIVPDSQEST